MHCLAAGFCGEEIRYRYCMLSRTVRQREYVSQEKYAYGPERDVLFLGFKNILYLMNRFGYKKGKYRVSKN